MDSVLLGAVSDRIWFSTGGGEGCRGDLLEERLKDRCCIEGGGCGGDGIWARKKGAHCGGQPTLPTEERNSELLGCGCGKACPIALFVSPFEHCHTRFWSVSGSGAQRGVAEVWEPSVQGRGRNAGRPREMQKSVSMVQLHVCGGAAACVRWRSPAQQATHSPWRNQRAGWPPWQRRESCSCRCHCCRWSHWELQVVHPRQ